MTAPDVPRDTGAGVGAGMTYGGYLSLDTLLATQRPISGAHDEMLFIIQHQTAELWMRLALHEIGAARETIAAGRLRPAFKMLTRIARIFEQLNSAWDVLRTMTPTEFTRFRDALGGSSGIQSRQYRQIEFALGNRDAAIMPRDPEAATCLRAELARPSLYDVALDRLAATRPEVPAAVLSRDRSVRHAEDAGVEAAWRAVYRAPEAHWELYELGEKLVDLEDYFRRWRFNHVTTVERIIGFKRGTGGTPGVAYLRRMLEVELFPELWRLRTSL